LIESFREGDREFFNRQGRRFRESHRARAVRIPLERPHQRAAPLRTTRFGPRGPAKTAAARRRLTIDG
jgi:hypothetical protein